jgi:hypothetical protein
MEAESRLVCDVVERELFGRPLGVAVDCHSGFGMRDRLWFPFAFTTRPVPHIAEINALFDLFDDAHPHHHYVIEPQSRHYLAHGDLWDYLYLRNQASGGGVFLPVTLEMGSWSWIRKRPRQVFSRQGLFNPMVEHRQRRTLRRHAAWLDFAARAACRHARWMPRGSARSRHEARALARWYSTHSR